MPDRDQLRKLATPFPDSLVQRLPGKGAADYVAHGAVKQRLLEVCGPYSFEVVQIVGADTVLARLTVEIDGRTVSILEAGQSDNQQDPIKSAVSDAFKRCCAHIGLGLHLWNSSYWLDTKLAEVPE